MYFLGDFYLDLHFLAFFVNPFSINMCNQEIAKCLLSPK